MAKNTKIVATISDKNCDIELIQKLYSAGVNVVRLNTAHQTFEDSLKVINNVRKVSNKIALLLDTKGPEIRTTHANVEIKVDSGDIVKIAGKPDAETSKELICVNYRNFVEDVPLGSRILIDDGELELVVIQKNKEFLNCEVKNSGVIEGRKSVNIPSVHIKLPALSEKDKNYIKFAAENKLDFIAHSFVRNKGDVKSVQEILDSYNSNIKIIAKIENQEGVENIDEILEHAYGIMIARGDLAIEVPREQIPFIQKKLIRKCIKERKPVIVATQMLHSMIKNPRPTRAEVSDIATAIYDGADAIMLSGETAYGKYPLESVETMTQIAIEIESRKDKYLELKYKKISSETSAYLCKSAVKSAIRLKANAIVADTLAGNTLRNVAGFRGQTKVLALAYKENTMRELALSYGVSAYFIEPQDSTDEFINYSVEKLMTEGELNSSAKIVILAGSFRKSKGANFIQIVKVKDILSKEK